jgi:hypothetical protein
MSKLKLLNDEATASATLSASTTSGSLVVANLKNNDSAAVWRATGNSATITATWASSVSVGGAVLAWTNLASNATVSVEFFTETADVTPVATATGYMSATLPVDSNVFGVTTGSVADAVGLNNTAQAWLPTNISVRKVVITINNAQAIQVGRLVLGARHEMRLGASQGASLKFVDKSTIARTESGSIRSEGGTVHREMSVDLTLVNHNDSLALLRLAKMGRTKVLFVSLFADRAHEFFVTHSFVAVLADDLTHKIDNPFVAKTDMTFEEII